jgi:hypothetical protein
VRTRIAARVSTPHIQQAQPRQRNTTVTTPHRTAQPTHQTLFQSCPAFYILQSSPPNRPQCTTTVRPSDPRRRLPSNRPPRPAPTPRPSPSDSLPLRLAPDERPATLQLQDASLDPPAEHPLLHIHSQHIHVCAAAAARVRDLQHGSVRDA